MVYVPVVNRAESVGLRAGLERVDLGGVQPGEWQPSSAEEGDVDEKTYSSTVGSTSLGRGNKAGEGKNHSQALSNGTDQEELTATDTLNDKPRCSREDGIDNHVDTSQKKGEVVVRTESVLAKNGKVVDDSVATRQLLHELRRGTEDHAAEVLGLAVGEEKLGGDLAATTSLADGILDDTHLEQDLGVITTETVQTSKNRCSFVLAVMGEEPSRRFGQLNHQSNDDECEHTLESDGESPGEVIGAVETAVIDPVGNKRSDGNHATLDTNDLSAVLGLAASYGMLVFPQNAASTKLTQLGRWG